MKIARTCDERHQHSNSLERASLNFPKDQHDRLLDGHERGADPIVVVDQFASFLEGSRGNTRLSRSDVHEEQE